MNIEYLTIDDVPSHSFSRKFPCPKCGENQVRVYWDTGDEEPTAVPIGTSCGACEIKARPSRPPQPFIAKWCCEEFKYQFGSYMGIDDAGEVIVYNYDWHQCSNDCDLRFCPWCGAEIEVAWW